jgi:hypothetical protein
MAGCDLEHAPTTATDQERRMRTLGGPGVTLERGDPVVTPVESERARGEQSLEHLDRFGETFDPDVVGLERKPGPLVLLGIPACTEANLQPTTAQPVKSGQLVGKNRWVSEVVVEHEGSDP